MKYLHRNTCSDTSFAEIKFISKFLRSTDMIESEKDEKEEERGRKIEKMRELI